MFNIYKAFYFHDIIFFNLSSLPEKVHRRDKVWQRQLVASLVCSIIVHPPFCLVEYKHDIAIGYFLVRKKRVMIFVQAPLQKGTLWTGLAT